MLALVIGRVLLFNTVDFTIFTDYLTILRSARSLLSGQGIVFPVTGTDDLSHIKHVQMLIWPPGAAIALAPLVSAGLPDAFSLWFAEAIGVALFFLSLFWLTEGRALSLPIRERAAVWLLALLGEAALPVGHASDLLATGLFALSAAAGAAAVAHRRAGPALLATLAAALAASLRYAFWPLVPAFALARWSCSSVRRLRPALTALACVAVAGAAAAPMLRRSGLTFVPAAIRHPASLHWDNLLFLCPFPADFYGWGAAWNGIQGASPFTPMLASPLARSTIAAGALASLIVLRVWIRVGSVVWRRGPAERFLILYALLGMLAVLATLGWIGICAERPTKWFELVFLAQRRFYSFLFLFALLAASQFAVPRRGRRRRMAVAVLALSVAAGVLEAAWATLDRPTLPWNGEALRWWKDGGSLQNVMEHAERPGFKSVLIEPYRQLDDAAAAAIYLGIAPAVGDPKTVPATTGPVNAIIAVPAAAPHDDATLTALLSAAREVGEAELLVRTDQPGKTRRYAFYRVVMGARPPGSAR